MRACWLALAAVLVFTSCAVDAATFKCGFSWRVGGQELYTGIDIPSACQAKCEQRSGCKFFYTTENPNSQGQVSCHVMGSVGATKVRDDGVMVICANANVWPQLAVPEYHVGTPGNPGTLIPASPLNGTTGAYHRVASSTGGIGIHVTMIPNTDEVVLFGRPQDPKYAIQPGMEVGHTGVEWPSSIVNVRTGAYRPVQSEMGAPFCADQVHTVNGDILVCGGDDAYINWPGNGGWGGYKGCRYLTKNSSGLMEWKRLPNMSGAHWYPSMIELPPKVSGSQGTCALVLGGEKNVDPYAGADRADIACPQMGVVFGNSINDVGSTSDVTASLRQNFPTAYLLPVGDVPAAPQVALFSDLGGNVVQVNIDFNNKNLRLNSIKVLPRVNMDQFSFNSPSGSVLRALDLSKPLNKDTIEVLLFGGAFWTDGPFPGTDQMFRIKPLADNPTWEKSTMPSRAILRWAINLPNGKILNIGGARLGKPSGGSVCCSSLQASPIMNAWIYNPATGQFWVDPVLMPRYRLYHNTAWLARDGSILISGGDQGISPNNRPDFTMDTYETPAIRKAIAAGVRPAIISSPSKFKYGQNLTIKIKGGYASRCSLSKPAAVTHTSASSHRMLLLKTVKNAMDKKVLKNGGTLVVATPKSAYVAPPGWWLLYCWNGDVWTAANWIYLLPK